MRRAPRHVPIHPDKQGPPLAQRRVVAGPVRGAVAGGCWFAYAARLTAGIRSVNPRSSDFCNNAVQALDCAEAHRNWCQYVRKFLAFHPQGNIILAHRPKRADSIARKRGGASSLGAVATLVLRPRAARLSLGTWTASERHAATLNARRHFPSAFSCRDISLRCGASVSSTAHVLA
jgi:hypothetical protein